MSPGARSARHSARVAFFYQHAGYSYKPGAETEAQGRMRCARTLARAECEANAAGFYYLWSVDPTQDSSEWSDERPAWAVWQCAMYNPNGHIVASLHGIDFGRDGEPWGQPYRRVVEAELASEGLAAEPQGRGSIYWHIDKTVQS